jgi:hypothetical protein
MTLLNFMFDSLYDQYALIIMAAGLAINAILDLIRWRQSKAKAPIAPIL